MSKSQNSLLSRYKDRTILTRRERITRETREEETIRFALSNGGTETLNREDALGHDTRFSDSSLYDEVCKNCGATDGHNDNRLQRPCPRRKS